MIRNDILFYRQLLLNPMLRRHYQYLQKPKREIEMRSNIYMYTISFNVTQGQEEFVPTTFVYYFLLEFARHKKIKICIWYIKTRKDLSRDQYILAI